MAKKPEPDSLAIALNEHMNKTLKEVCHPQFSRSYKRQKFEQNFAELFSDRKPCRQYCTPLNQKSEEPDSESLFQTICQSLEIDFNPAEYAQIKANQSSKQANDSKLLDQMALNKYLKDLTLSIETQNHETKLSLIIESNQTQNPPESHLKLNCLEKEPTTLLKEYLKHLKPPEQQQTKTP